MNKSFCVLLAGFNDEGVKVIKNIADHVHLRSWMLLNVKNASWCVSFVRIKAVCIQTLLLLGLSCFLGIHLKCDSVDNGRAETLLWKKSRRHFHNSNTNAQSWPTLIRLKTHYHLFCFTLKWIAYIYPTYFYMYTSKHNSKPPSVSPV